MAKFIIEVSDGYIHERADVTNITNNVSKDEGGVLKGMMEMITFGSLDRELKEGKTEFYLSSQDIEDDKERKLFNNMMAEVAAVATIQEIHTEKRNKEQLKAEENGTD